MNESRLLADTCRWTARFLGTLQVLTIVAIFFGERMPNFFIQPLWAQFIFLGLVLILLGILAGWRWERTGGLLSLAGFCLGFVPLYNSPRGVTWFYIALALPGALYVASALLRRPANKNPAA